MTVEALFEIVAEQDVTYLFNMISLHINRFCRHTHNGGHHGVLTQRLSQTTLRVPQCSVELGSDRDVFQRAIGENCSSFGLYLMGKKKEWRTRLR